MVRARERRERRVVVNSFMVTWGSRWFIILVRQASVKCRVPETNYCPVAVIQNYPMKRVCCNFGKMQQICMFLCF